MRISTMNRKINNFTKFRVFIKQAMNNNLNIPLKIIDLSISIKHIFLKYLYIFMFLKPKKLIFGFVCLITLLFNAENHKKMTAMSLIFN